MSNGHLAKSHKVVHSGKWVVLLQIVMNARGGFGARIGSSPGAAGKYEMRGSSRIDRVAAKAPALVAAGTGRRRMTRASPVPCSWIAVLLALLSIVPCCVDVALSEEQAVQAGQTFRDCADCPELVVIPAGSFLMGSSSEVMARDLKDATKYEKPSFVKTDLDLESPQHPVSIDAALAIGKHLVMRAEFAAFVRETGYSTDGDCTLWTVRDFLRPPDAGWRNPGFSQTDRDPAVCISWQDARAYVAWLNNKVHGPIPAEGPYRLPSEAEWEYAARAGTRTSRWWGDEIGSGNANCRQCGSRWDELQTSPVGSLQTNAFGLSDMLGNVWEWTEDCWHETYDETRQNSAAWTTGNCDRRVIRGGSWTNLPWVLRSSVRSRGDFDARTNYRGFRVAKILQGK
jgi:formylglycine-generating enzyme required for sulfatase activity